MSKDVLFVQKYLFSYHCIAKIIIFVPQKPSFMPLNNPKEQTYDVHRTFFSSLKEIGGVELPKLNNMPVVTANYAVTHRVCPYEFAKQWLQKGMPYQVDDYRFVLFHKADFDVSANLQQYHITDATLAFVGNGSIMQFESEVPADIQVSALLLKYDYMRYIMHDHLPNTKLNNIKNAVLQLDVTQSAIIEQMICTLYLLVCQSDCDRLTIESQTAALISYICGLYVRNTATLPKSYTRAESLFNAFIELVNQYYAEQHQLHFYADRLCVTDRYLSSLVSQVSQVSAKEWIDRALIAKAKVALRHSDITSTQLSDQLNFPNTAFFCKYFKRIVGCTPTEYRQAELAR